jgi:hypothetical protein
MIRFLLTLLCSIFFVSSNGQALSPKGKITGLIVNAADKKALENVTLTLILKATGEQKITVSNNKGNFELTIFDTGLYSVVISHMGYKEQTLSIKVANDFTGWHLGNCSITTRCWYAGRGFCENRQATGRTESRPAGL